LSVVQKRNCCV